MRITAASLRSSFAKERRAVVSLWLKLVEPIQEMYEVTRDVRELRTGCAELSSSRLSLIRTAFFGEPLHCPGGSPVPQFRPPHPRHAPHHAVTGRRILPRAKRDVAERAPGVLGPVQPREHARPCSKFVQGWESFVSEEAGQRKTVSKAEAEGDLFPRADSPSAEQQRVHHSADSKRERRQTSPNSLNERTGNHGDQHERDDPDCEARST
jgi:hypothetical protein